MSNVLSAMIYAVGESEQIIQVLYYLKAFLGVISWSWAPSQTYFLHNYYLQSVGSICLDIEE